MGIEDPPEDVAEQQTPVVPDSDDDGSAELDDPPWEADPADVIEQLLPPSGAVLAEPDDLPFEADPADVAEQLRTVPVDDPDVPLD